MSTPRPLPARARALLPSTDRSAPAEELGDGTWIVAGRHALIILSQDAVIDSGMWYEVGAVKWQAEDHMLCVDWVDPARRPLRVATLSADPHALMRRITERVDRSLVVHTSARMPNGTRVSVWIRRREDDELFSVLTAYGPLDEASAREARRLEADARESVGLDDAPFKRIG